MINVLPLKIDDLQPGDPLLYAGKYFLGYEPDDVNMTFIEPGDNQFSIWVKYKTNKLVVDIFDVIRLEKV